MADLPPVVAAPPPSENLSANAPSQAATAPQELPEKYRGKSPAELARMHQELERKLGERAPAAPPPNGAIAQIPEAPPDPAVALAAFATEYGRTGQLSAQSYQALEAKGYPRSYVDSFLAGQQAQGKLALMEAHTLVGGQANFDAMLQWAGQNLSREEQAVFNRCNDPALFKTLVQGYHARWRAAIGSGPAAAVVGSAAAGGGSQGFSSEADFRRAMVAKDEKGGSRYSTDPAYREEVAAKLAASSWAETSSTARRLSRPLAHPSERT